LEDLVDALADLALCWIVAVASLTSLLGSSRRSCTPAEESLDAGGLEPIPVEVFDVIVGDFSLFRENYVFPIKEIISST
jgi:hypothetical protein